MRFLVSTVLELCGFGAWVGAAFLLWGVVTDVEAAEAAGADVAARGLMSSVRERVDAAGLLGTPDGEAAIALAVAMSLPVNQDGSKFASLYAKLTVALDRLDAQAPVATRVDDLRLRRDRKRARGA